MLLTPPSPFLGRLWEGLAKHQTLVALPVSAVWCYAGYISREEGNQVAPYVWTGIGLFSIIGYSLGSLAMGWWLEFVLGAAWSALQIWVVRKYW